MYQVLARKLRPTLFEDVVGQEHITKSLQNAILKDKIGHAYIFSGTRGVGKTTVARIFAKAIRCEDITFSGNPCEKCKSCLDFDTSSSLDVLEIDGASNNSVDDIRDLVLNVQYLPSFGQYKVYIIDEVHMLSTSAFNALLKTLEEPPAHVKFIFATTEPNKLLETVLSRCQRFDFLSASLLNLNKLLTKIAITEKILFEDDSIINRICEAGNESFRDTLSLLDQVLSFADEGMITEDILVVALGLARTSAIKDLVDAILKCDLKSSSQLYRGLLAENTSLENISRGILDVFYQRIMSWNEKAQSINLAEAYWVYETFAKEINWNLESISPKKTTELLIQKICLRREVFKSKIVVDSAETEKKTETETETKAKAKTETKAKTEIETKAEIEIETKAKIEIETKAEIEIETKAKIEIENEAKTKIDSETEIENINTENLNKSLKSVNSSNIENLEHHDKLENVEITKDTEEIVKIKKNSISEISQRLSGAQKLKEFPTNTEEGISSVLRVEVENKLDELINKESGRHAIEDNAKAKIDVEKTWLNFIDYLRVISPASASTLEQGNLLTEIIFDGTKVSIDLGFTASSQVFLDYLQEEIAHETLMKNLGLFFECEKENIDLKLELASSEHDSFVSLAEINQQKYDDKLKIQKEELLANPLLQEAQIIFNSSIDKVVLGKNHK